MTEAKYRNVKFESRFDQDQPWTEVTERDNISPYISMDDFEKDIRAQRFPNALVIPIQKIRVLFKYPLQRSVVFEFTSEKKNGFTRADLARKIGQAYHQIYQEEEAAVGNPGHVPGMLNRKNSNGPYGIWGHDPGDLVLHQVIHQGGNLFTLGIDS